MSMSLPQELDGLIHRMQAGERDDLESLLELAEYRVREYLTDAQARALVEMLGYGRADYEAALDRARN